MKLEVIAVKSHEHYMREVHACLRECLASVMHKSRLQWKDLNTGGTVFVRTPIHSLQEIRLDVARGRLRASDIDAPNICQSRLQAANRALSSLMKKKPQFATVESQVPAYLVDALIIQLNKLLDDWPESEEDDIEQHSRVRYPSSGIGTLPSSR